jgi:hypothetical protein
MRRFAGMARSFILFLFVFHGTYLKAQDTLRFFADSVKTDSLKVTWKVTHPELVDSFVVEHYDGKGLVKSEIVRSASLEHVYCSNVLWIAGDNSVKIGFYRGGRLKYTNLVPYSRKWDYVGWGKPLWVRGGLDLGGLHEYEIYDKYGNRIRKGKATMVDVSDLPYDVYYLFYDNSVREFISRRKKH